MRTLRCTAAVLLLAVSLAGATVATPADDYSQRLDALWDFAQPAKSEALFRAEADRHPPHSREAAEAATQVARAQGLQQRYADADATLDRVERALDAQPARVRVRYLLERGRHRNSSGSPTDALRWFEDALATSKHDELPGAAYYRVDALHMLAIASPPERQLDWHRQALAAAESAQDARARGWRGSLLHNLGWTMHERGDYAAAVDYWRKALAEREAAHDVVRTRIARWTVARGLRSLGSRDEAERMQRALASELAAADAPDGFVFEELAELALARGDRGAAQQWAAQALAILRNDPEARMNDAARLARLTDLAASPAAR